MNIFKHNKIIRVVDRIKTVFGREKLTNDVLLCQITDILLFHKNELLNNHKKFKQSDVNTIIQDLNIKFGENVVSEFNLDSFFRGLNIILSLKRNRKTMIERHFSSYLIGLTERINTLKPYDLKDYTGDEEYEELQKVDSKIILKIPYKQFRTEKIPLQIELLKMQEWIKKNDYKLAIIFEGRDSAGKGSAIKMITEFLQPKYFKVNMFDVPTNEEKTEWFKRYENNIPKLGQIVFFDRSWYNRAVNDPVMGYCTLDEYNKFMNDVIPFEEKLIEEGVHLIKIWFSVSQEMQKIRFKLRQTNPLKSWKLSDNDVKTLNKWNQFSIYKERMFIETSTQKNPWIVVESDNKRVAQLNVLKYILNSVDYEGKDEEVIGKPFSEIVILMI